MNWGRFLLVVLGAAVGSLLAFWWLSARRSPVPGHSTLSRAAHTPVEWIELK